MRGLSRKGRKTVSNELPKAGFISIPYADASAEDQLCHGIGLKCMHLNASCILADKDAATPSMVR
jgi:hypothetical protein